MATIVNTPGTSDSSGSNGMLIGIVLVIAVLLLFWFFGMPYFRGAGGGANTTPTNTIENNVQAPEAPAADGGDTNINVPIPDEVDVNVQGDNPTQ